MSDTPSQAGSQELPTMEQFSHATLHVYNVGWWISKITSYNKAKHNVKKLKGLCVYGDNAKQDSKSFVIFMLCYSVSILSNVLQHDEKQNPFEIVILYQAFQSKRHAVPKLHLMLFL